MERSGADNDLLADQRAFYRARAPEYDQWWLRQGPYDHGPADTAEWDRQVAQVTQALNEFAPVGNVLELAGGTGWWTRELARWAASLTVVDSSEETLTINGQRVGRADVSYQVADIFSWQPGQRYDAVFFSFWLSHVPRERFDDFWALIASCLAPEGRVFFIDNRRNPSPTATDPYIIDEADDVQRRRLSDGSEHRVVKVFYEPDELADRLRALGWTPRLAGTSRFIYGSAAPW
jgi:demethylmenaquinone methyltransferase/2-methoxy-6-polyprenyl-1,4-benzoquinol methylase